MIGQQIMTGAIAYPSSEIALIAPKPSLCGELLGILCTVYHDLTPICKMVIYANQLRIDIHCCYFVSFTHNTQVIDVYSTNLCGLDFRIVCHSLSIPVTS